MKTVTLAPALLITLVCGAVPAQAQTLTSFDMPLSFSIESGSANLSGAVSNFRPFSGLSGVVDNYLVIGQACMDGWCGGTGVDGTINTPVVLRLTDVTATCLLPTGNCGRLSFYLDWGAEAPIAPGYGGMLQPVSVSLTGSSDAHVSGALKFGANGLTSTSATLALASGAGSFTYAASAGSIFVEDGNGSFGLYTNLDLDGLAAGSSFRLPNSLEFTVGIPTAVPELASLRLMLAGLAGLAAVARRGNKRALAHAG